MRCNLMLGHRLPPLGLTQQGCLSLPSMSEECHRIDLPRQGVRHWGLPLGCLPFWPIAEPAPLSVCLATKGRCTCLSDWGFKNVFCVGSFVFFRKHWLQEPPTSPGPSPPQLPQPLASHFLDCLWWRLGFRHLFGLSHGLEAGNCWAPIFLIGSLGRQPERRS